MQESKIFTKTELQEMEIRKKGDKADKTGIFSSRVKPKIIELLEWFSKRKELKKLIEVKEDKKKICTLQSEKAQDRGKMQKRKLVKISIRVDEETLKKVMKLLGLTDNSKGIRACMNFTVNVAHNLFSGNLRDMFKRKKNNEEISLYDDHA